jgi:hypothetical protein
MSARRQDPGQSGFGGQRDIRAGSSEHQRSELESPHIRTIGGLRTVQAGHPSFRPRVGRAGGGHTGWTRARRTPKSPATASSRGSTLVSIYRRWRGTACRARPPPHGPASWQRLPTCAAGPTLPRASTSGASQKSPPSAETHATLRPLADFGNYPPSSPGATGHPIPRPSRHHGTSVARYHSLFQMKRIAVPHNSQFSRDKLRYIVLNTADRLSTLCSKLFQAPDNCR